MNNSINIRIKELRLKTKLSQELFAKSIGTNRPNYAQIEMGKQRPTIEILSNIHKVYDIPYEDIIDGIEGRIGIEVSNKLMSAYGINKHPCPECDKMKERIKELSDRINDKNKIISNLEKELSQTSQNNASQKRRAAG